MAIRILTLIIALAVVFAEPQCVFFSHDGGVDDFLALVLLAGARYSGTGEIELTGVAVTGADSYVIPATSATRKVLRHLFNSTVPVWPIWHAKPAVSSFPDSWRRASMSIDLFPVLNRAPPPNTGPSEGEDDDLMIYKSLEDEAIKSNS